MAKEFKLGDTLAEVLKVSGPDTTPEQIVFLPIGDIDADEKNFYSVDGVEALAANIELVGLLDPLRVRENPDMPGRYLIVSGHRRRAALWALFEENPEKWGKVPAIIEPPAASPELQELRLIYANADTRKMTSADLSAQAQRVELLLYQLKEQGMDFPGRMRDHVAEACKLSTTKLAELKVIREKLLPEWKILWEESKLSHTCAYRIARCKEETQRLLYVYSDPTHMTEWNVESRAQRVEKLRHRKCKLHPGSECFHDLTLIATEFGPGCYNCSSYACCCDCYSFTSCKASCPELDEAKEKLKKEAKAKRAVERQTEKDRDAELIGITRTCWQRFGELRRAQGLSAEDCCKARGDYFMPNYHGEDWTAEMEGPKAKITAHTPVPWTNSMQADDVEKLCKTADLFGVTTDYLLGRDDEKQRRPLAQLKAPPKFHSGDVPPEKEQLAWCVFDCAGAILEQAAIWVPHLEKWTFKGTGAGIDATCVGWYPLPTYQGEQDA